MSTFIGYQMQALLQGQSIFVVQLFTCIIALIMTEVASNATTATILLNVVESMVSKYRNSEQLSVES